MKVNGKHFEKYLQSKDITTFRLYMKFLRIVLKGNQPFIECNQGK